MAATAFAAVATPSAAVCAGARFSVVPPRGSLLLPTPPTRRSSAVSPIYSLQVSDASRFSSLRVRASSSEDASSSDELLADLKAKWDALDNKSTVLLYGGGAIVALWLSSIVVGAINSVPLLPKIMELVGLGYTGWFVYRYLLFKQSRKELASDIEDLKKKIAGSRHEIINENGWKFQGIVNGINVKDWNPELDSYLESDGYTNYSLETLHVGKPECKAALQKEVGLPVRDDVPVIAFIGRLDPQKGVDLIMEAMPWIAGQDVQVVMLGTGRRELEDMLRKSEAQYHNKVRAWVGFSVKMAHRITAGADILLMPSRFEPCGLNQLYAMNYGTIPVVHAVGGLRDTVIQFDPFNETGTGWTFDRAETNKLINALGNCLNTYWNHKESWKGLQKRGMEQDLSWENAAERYEEVLVAAKYQW